MERTSERCITAGAVMVLETCSALARITISSRLLCDLWRTADSRPRKSPDINSTPAYCMEWRGRQQNRVGGLPAAVEGCSLACLASLYEADAVEIIFASHLLLLFKLETGQNYRPLPADAAFRRPQIPEPKCAAF